MSEDERIPHCPECHCRGSVSAEGTQSFGRPLYECSECEVQFSYDVNGKCYDTRNRPYSDKSLCLCPKCQQLGDLEFQEGMEMSNVCHCRSCGQDIKDAELANRLRIFIIARYRHRTD